MKYKIKKKLGRNSLKEAVDTLPMGLCYFDTHGRVVLCNVKMHRLIFSIGNRDIQLYSDVKESLETPVSGVLREDNCYRLPDASIWQFSEKVVVTKSKQRFLEVIAGDITELKEKQEELLESNRRHRKMIADLERLLDYISIETREKEIFRMKMQVHNDLGDGLRGIWHFLAEGGNDTDRKRLLQQHKDILRVLQGEIGKKDTQDSFEEFKRIMKSLDRRLVMEGKMPEEESSRNLLVGIFRECRSNMIRHAGAKTMYVKIEESESELELSVYNDGKAPDMEIIEGGGLSALRRRIEEYGGSMSIHSFPRFMLIATVPRKEI